MILTRKRLMELLFYDPNSGYFIWKVYRNYNAKRGDVAGWERPDGYIHISIDGKRYLTHRLAWLYVHGYFPENEIDHKDRNPSNNKIENLREESRQCQMRNTGIRKDNTSGIKGVRLHKASGKYEAQIKINKKTKFLGLYKKIHNAVCARLAAEQCLNWHNCDSRSPAYVYVQEMLRASL